MNKYLLEILKERNTIIIPGLGALTVTNKDTGETMFMPYLQHEDGKLAAFIAEKDGVDETDAKNIVAKFVREIKAELDKGESYSMFELGTFKKKDDGDIEFENWTSTPVEEETPAPASVQEETPVEEEIHVEEETHNELAEASEPEPIVEPAPVVVSEPTAVNEPESVESESSPEPEPLIEPEPTVEPDPVVASEPVETKQTTIPPVTPPVYESYSDEDDFIPERTTLEPSPLLDDIAPTSPVDLGEESDSNLVDEEADGESEAENEKKKAGVGFWITLIIVALGIIAGGAYVGRNYNQLKQHIPFLADEDKEAEKKSLKEEISSVIEEDKYAKPDRTSELDEGESNEGENVEEEGTEEGSAIETNDRKEEVAPKPEVKKPEVKKPEVKTPKPVTIASSSGGPYKVIAGAFSSQDNANRLAAEFKAKGMNSEVFLKGELHAVSVQSYATSEEAKANLAKLQTMAPGAWIYYKR